MQCVKKIKEYMNSRWNIIVRIEKCIVDEFNGIAMYILLHK